MGDLARLLKLLRPYRLLFIASIVVTVLSSVLEGFTFVLLIPFLRALFGEQVLPAEGGSAVESLLHKIAGPFLAAGSPDTALRNVVLVVLGALVLKNATGDAAAALALAPAGAGAGRAHEPRRRDDRLGQTGARLRGRGV